MMAHPDVLRNLLTRYESLQRALRFTPCPQMRGELDDVAYTLCVSTATRDIGQALTAARRHIEAPVSD